jgi:hypothetical protein
MTCNTCETNFQGSQTVILSVIKSGTNVLLYVQNQGRNIVQLRRVLLCSALPGGGSWVLFLRPSPDQISWVYPSAFVEPGLTALLYTLSGASAGSIVQAQAEYIELDGRGRSCSLTV